MQIIEPETDISPANGRWLATGPEPWLRFRPFGRASHAGWLELTYRSGFYDDPVRPILRLWRSDRSFEDVYLPAPVLGRGRWIGWLPQDVAALSVCPAATTGLLSFEIEQFSVPGLPELLSRATRGAKHLTAAAVLLGLGKALRARKRLARAVLERPISGYEPWAALRRRTFDPIFDQPRSKNHDDASFELRLEVGHASPKALEGTLGTLLEQTHANWVLKAAPGDGSAAAQAVLASYNARDARIGANRDYASECAPIVCVLQAGDALLPYALSLVADRFCADAEVQAIRADIELIQPNGALRPGFAPAGSHLADADLPGLGLVFHRGSRGLKSPMACLRRVIATRAAAPHLAKASPRTLQAGPQVSIVVPTRDRVALLRACIEGLTERTSYSNVDITIIDNDSKDPETLAYLASLDPARIAVHRFPGPFNFSAICNFGARQTSGEIIGFLNNDVEIVEPDWLGHLVSWAQRDQVGAVGPLLIYPNGRLQHAGVIVGHGRGAGHIYVGAPVNEPGLWGEVQSPHEVSAVTGACLAVARDKFDAVGGFDAEVFAVTLNDIDLCLRLGAKGWATIMTPFSKLIHKESATRGRKAAYPLEVTAFQERWGRTIRDDPFFHPAYSLDSLTPALA